MVQRRDAIRCCGWTVAVLACAAIVAGCPSPLGRGILVYPLSLDFSGTDDALTINVTNRCSDGMVWEAAVNQPWIAVTPDSGAGAFTQVTVTVTRALTKQMAVGKNTATIRFTSNGGIQNVPVTAWFWPERRFQKSYDEVDSLLQKQEILSEERFNDCEICPDGGYVAVGWIKQTYTVPIKTGAKALGDVDCYMVRVDMEGDKVWAMNWGMAGRTEATAVVATDDGDYVVCGYQEIEPGDDESGLASGSYVQLTKVGGDGHIHWSKTYGDGFHWAWGMKQTPDGGFIVTAGGNPLYGSEPYPTLIKTDSEGELEWTRKCPVPYLHDPYDVAVTSDGGYIVTGVSWPGLEDLSRTGRPGSMTILDKQGGFADLFLMKTDRYGNGQWRKEFGGPGQDYGYGVVALPDGYAACGMWDGMSEGAAYVVRTDLAGNEVWQKSYSSGSCRLGGGIVSDGDGNLFVSGYAWVSLKATSGHSQAVLFKVLDDGAMDWMRQFGDLPDMDEFWRLRLAPDGGLVCAGGTMKMDEDWDAMIVKTDANGFVSPP